MNKQFVLDKTSKKVLRFGYCNFEAQENFNSDIEEVLEVDITLDPYLHEQDWYWNATTEEFQGDPLT